MFIHVGSTNEVKVQAVRDVCKLYPALSDALIISHKTKSGVSEQPMSLDETVLGSINRANAAAGFSLDPSSIGIGIESGLMKVPYTLTGYMDFCSVAIYTPGPANTPLLLGLSPAFECPKEVIDLVLSEGLDLNEAFLRAGLTTDPKLGNSEGAVGMLTGGRITRQEYTKQALIMALIGLDRK